MAKGGGYFKGEKKKQKKGKDKSISGFSSSTTVPTFSMPEVISKKKKNDW